MLRLMYITNRPEIARIAENSGVDWIFIDLEVLGKAERQGHLDTVMSKHSPGDIRLVKSVLKKAKLLVRVNPIHDESKSEIGRVIQNGADIVMLPYFKTTGEVENFIEMVDKKAKTCLLVETPAAVDNIDKILKVSGIDYIHLGLNDLHLGYGMKFMFELLSDGTVERLCMKFKEKKITYGFGGIARLGMGSLPAEMVIAEHYRIGSSMAILSRSFCDTNRIKDMDTVKEVFTAGVTEIRNFENFIMHKDTFFFENNKHMVADKVRQITNLLNQ